MKLKEPKPLKELKKAYAYAKEERVILKQVKKNNGIVYGGQAIKKQIGVFARPTQDYDVLIRNPGKNARRLERRLDKNAGGDYYYSKPAMHPGTYKVKHKGLDNKKDTEDDMEVADFTKPARKYRTIKSGGVKYVHLSEVVKDKKKALRDKQFAFRHAKDREDIARIRLARRR